VVVQLDRSNIDSYVAQPGVALLNWQTPDSPMSRVFDVGYENVSARHPDVRFADVDVKVDLPLAVSWGVAGAPELMAYRDGMLVFDYAGALPEPVVDALIDAIWSLDMDRIRQGTNGHGARLYLALQPSGMPRFALGGGGGGGGPGQSPTGQSAKH
jgi:thioredoxin 1